MGTAVAVPTALALFAGTSVGQEAGGGFGGMSGDMQETMEGLSTGLSNLSFSPTVNNTTSSEYMAAHNKAVADWKASKAAGRPGGRGGKYAKPIFVAQWAGKENAADRSGRDVMTLLRNGTVNPEGFYEFGTIQFQPGLDALAMIDGRKYNVDGSRNAYYGKVINFVKMPLPFGIESESHHAQYAWEDNQAMPLGGLFNDTVHVMDVKNAPQVSLKKVVTPLETPLGTVPDAFDVGGGTPENPIFMWTSMGGPNYNFAGSPGAVEVMDNNGNMLSETPAGNMFGAWGLGNAGGVPEPCDPIEGRPLGTCANPHGIQARVDIKRMVTSDYAEPREIVLDPLKTLDKHVFRPTVRVWDTTTTVAPKLISVAHMPESSTIRPNRGHDNIGIMENAKTYGASRGWFAGSMCGGGIFFTPDIMKASGDSSKQWVEVANDGMGFNAAREEGTSGANGDTPQGYFQNENRENTNNPSWREASEEGQLDNTWGGVGHMSEEPGGCAGGPWIQITRNNRYMFRALQGRTPQTDNLYDLGTPKFIWSANVEKLILSAMDGQVDCNVDTPKEVALGGDEADCPFLTDVLLVEDITTGGPHWAAMDTHTMTADGMPTRLVLSNYFVARTGTDGNHRVFLANIDPNTGEMQYDRSWRDEFTGAIGVDFNRRYWPGDIRDPTGDDQDGVQTRKGKLPGVPLIGLAGSGFYKPHAQAWICPDDICPMDEEVNNTFNLGKGTKWQPTFPDNPRLSETARTGGSDRPANFDSGAQAPTPPGGGGGGGPH